MPSLERLRTAIADRYEIKRELGHGAMATVYLARDLKHDREVAVKVLRDDVGFALGHERFRREIELVTHLSHPHILPIYDSGEAGGELFYVMPYVEGESLRSKLNRERQLPVDEAVRITCEVASALDHSHRHGIIHRDIKPENILIEDGQALLADFGIARAASLSGEKLTSTGVSLGTPTYMSPEQGMADPNIDARSDIYSLGCVLYEMLAGQPPFTGNTTQALIARHSLDQVPSLSVVRSSIPEPVEDAIMVALEKVPADRFATAADFVNALRATQGSGMHSVRRTGHRTRSGIKPNRDWRVVAGITALALLVLSGAAWASKEFLMKDRAAAATASGFRSQRIAVLYFKDLTPDKRLGYLASGLTESLISDLSEVSALDVVSTNGVKQFEGKDISRDSIASALEAGTVVDGAVESEGNQARATVRLIDGNSGVDLDRLSVVAPLGDPLALKTKLSDAIAQDLRKVVGQEVRLRASRAGTQNPTAWSLVQRAQKLSRDADALGKNGNTDGAAKLLLSTDTLLAQAEALDGSWAEPIVLRAATAFKQEQLSNDLPVEQKAIETGIAHADRAIALDPRNADAFQWRGSLRIQLIALGLVEERRKVDEVVRLAGADLRKAIEINPTQAVALYELSRLQYVGGDAVESYNLARRAYEADAYLTAAPDILWRLYVTSYDLGSFVNAEKWCDQLNERFPSSFDAARCQLWIMTAGTNRDPAEAAKRAARYVSAAPPQSKDYIKREGQIVVADVLGFAGQKDSARKVLVAARADRKIDPRGELQGLEAFVRAQIGDKKEAIDILQKYLTDHPEHRDGFTKARAWWWRPIEDDPRFKSLIATG